MSKTLLEREQDHPQEIVVERDGRRVVTMDSARYVDARNTDRDVVVPASYIGVLPARMVAIHRPRGVIGHDACVGKDGAGIAGLWYLEALGIPAATADGMTADMGNGEDLYRSGVVKHVNYVAETCGVKAGMTVAEAADVLLDNEPTDTTVGNKVRREVVETHGSGRRVVVTDSIVWAYPEDEDTSVLVTAGHTGRSGAKFLLEARPWGFICHDGGMSKNRSGIAGLVTADEAGLAGACIDGTTAPIGDAFLGYEMGLISAHNEAAARRGVAVGMTVKEAAHLLLVGGG
ncbi:hypothetical protein I4I73_11325 [Pseudonocardia sp. KRD-184]|uniref:Uncharacterized protein n=1 Tax=Pseudonocardia oceani TaxID=2792013 RepID=A0ABS6UFA5_9PSEU|nr:hypothetical protein [Pseudonocardia oceani]MBW0088363.1 hypothetical protein [Pseudonocardia oceani]MBW0096576.1 hypothetical protein [Pseudonocardia oceani]MBW0109254.1 hypothetical protein [Pseudonocardia oceani]MBW0120311.1 hypothetical protein [Pseudonocardia oceani]MBW0130928.1 hypothetical protein [Pseudonocardia oceani]